MIGCLPTQALAFLAVFVYATHATQAIAFEWKPGFTRCIYYAIKRKQPLGSLEPRAFYLCHCLCGQSLTLTACCLATTHNKTQQTSRVPTTTSMYVGLFRTDCQLTGRLEDGGGREMAVSADDCIHRSVELNFRQSN